MSTKTKPFRIVIHEKRIRRFARIVWAEDIHDARSQVLATEYDLGEQDGDVEWPDPVWGGYDELTLKVTAIEPAEKAQP